MRFKGAAEEAVRPGRPAQTHRVLGRVWRFADAAVPCAITNEVIIFAIDVYRVPFLPALSNAIREGPVRVAGYLCRELVVLLRS